MTKPKNKRVNLTMPMEWYEPLERWAELQTRDPGNLALAIVITRLREALKNGEIPDEDGEKEEDETKIFLLSLLGDKRPKDIEIVKLAHDLNVKEEQLIELCDRLFGKEKIKR